MSAYLALAPAVNVKVLKRGAVSAYLALAPAVNVKVLKRGAVFAYLALAPSTETSSVLLAPSCMLSTTLASVASATMLLAMLFCLHVTMTT